MDQVVWVKVSFNLTHWTWTFNPFVFFFWLIRWLVLISKFGKEVEGTFSRHVIEFIGVWVFCHYGRFIKTALLCRLVIPILYDLFSKESFGFKSHFLAIKAKFLE